MVKVIQFGEGNFLRTFADYYFSKLNEEGFNYQVVIFKPRPHGNLDKFKKQNNRYNVILRGKENGKIIETVYAVNSVIDTVNPFTEREKFYAYARDTEVKLIISNTTEAGIVFNGSDNKDDFESISFPAKLTLFLYERFKASVEGKVYVLPTELIDNNATELKRCVLGYIELWKMDEAFLDYVLRNVIFANTLVDRIVSGYPPDVSRVDELIGYHDELVSVGEPFGLWAIENVDGLDEFIKTGNNGVEVVLTDNISYYKKRKVRVLNGSHTNIVPIGLISGAVTVADCMENEKLLAFFENTLKEEIIPFVSDDVEKTTQFALSVKERFENPYLNHKLSSIALNSISKWKARVLPSFTDYYKKNNKIPYNFTVGFSYLLALYSMAKKCKAGYFVNLFGKEVELKDTPEYLEYLSSGKPIEGFMSDKKIWGEDLSLYEDFVPTVKKNVEFILSGKSADFY